MPGIPGPAAPRMDDPADQNRLIELGRQALRIEAAAVQALVDRLETGFVAACRLCLHCRGRVVVSGMGKSGHVGRKIAATLASTGTPAFFLHPAEASHGDSGMLTRGDVVLAISNSGETAEVLTLLPLIKRLGTPLVAMTGNADSTLAREADAHLDISVSAEACPLNLAPTASTTATLAMGDALAVALLGERGFTPDDFARAHPGGTLGRRLLLRVADVMRKGPDLPVVHTGTALSQGLLEMSRKGLGMTAVVDGDRRVVGIFTDGDLRRALDRRIDVHHVTMGDVMTIGCRSIDAQELAAEAVLLMERHAVNGLLVLDAERRLVGALNVHDLLRAGIL
ncbi:MAG: KpsF/GutQ family sugar-phosphate isomerase [Gammaproteobacteria bacterium]|nr:KpsF/GutQ family sugar-phosphate isomerase [Gammaproteobacteria bacterium]